MKISQTRLFEILIILILSVVIPAGAQWESNFPYSKDIISLFVKGNNLFAGTVGATYFSTDNGSSWSSWSFFDGYDAYSFATKDSNLFEGTAGNGVRLVTSNGNSTPVNIGLTNLYVNALTVSGSNLFAGTDGGVFLSTNNGTSWTAVMNGVVLSFAVSGSNLFAGTSSGVFLSTNNGTSWIAVNSGLTNTNVHALAVSGSNLFAGTYKGGIFLSNNNGTSWVSANSGVNNIRIMSFALSGTNIFAGTANGVFLSTNHGTSWTWVMEGGYTVNALVVSGNNLFAGTESASLWKRPLSEMVTSIERDHNNVLIHFYLEQNFPNPFNPTTNISFSLPSRSFVSLKVFDLLGREVATLMNREKPVGTYQVMFDASKLPSGVYFYRLIAGDFTQVKKMLLVK